MYVRARAATGCRLDGRRGAVRSAELEAASGLSRHELARQFRRRFGTSPHRYSIMRRQAFARARIGDGTPLGALALQAGFFDQAHFSRAFKAAYGMTAGRFAWLRSSAGGA